MHYVHTNALSNIALEEQQLVRLEPLRGGFLVAHLTDRGQDVVDGRASKVDLLPEDIRKRLFAMLREKRITQLQIVEEINRLIEDAGLPPKQKLSRSGVNRLGTENERLARDLSDLREETAALTTELGDELGDKPTGETSRLIMEIARSLLFKGIRKHQIASQDSGDIDFITGSHAGRHAPGTHGRDEPQTRERDTRKKRPMRSARRGAARRGQDGMSASMERQIRDILLGKA